MHSLKAILPDYRMKVGELYIKNCLMVKKKVTITATNCSTKQWSTLILELNLIRKAWKPHGPKLELRTSNLKRIINSGTKNNENDHHHFSHRNSTEFSSK